MVRMITGSLGPHAGNPLKGLGGPIQGMSGRLILLEVDANRERYITLDPLTPKQNLRKIIGLAKSWVPHHVKETNHLARGEAEP